MADPLAPDDRDLGAELRRATSTLPGTGGDFADLTRRVRRRRASQAAMRAGIPALCVVLMGGGLFALTRQGPEADRPAAPTTSIAGPFTTSTVPPAPSSVPATGTVAPATAAPPSASGQASTVPDPTAASEPVTTVTTEPATTSPPVTPAAPVAATKSVFVDLGLTGGAVNLISVTDGTMAYAWSAADGKGLAFDPVTLESRPVASMPMAAAPVADGTWTWAGGRAFVRSVDTYALYDPATDAWTTGQMPEPRSGLSVTVWTGSRVLVWGGLPTTDGTGETPLDGLLLDPMTSSWSRTSKAPSARIGEVSAASAGGLVGIAGDAVGNFDTAPLLLYRPSDDTWSEAVPPIALPWTPFVAARGDRFVVIGLNHSASAEFDPATQRWTTALPTAPNNPGRHVHLAVSDGDRLMYLPGGGIVTVFDGTTWLPPAAVVGSFDAVWAADRLVVFGMNSSSIADATAIVSSIRGDQLVGQ